MDGTDVVEAITLAVNLDRYPYISVDYYALDKDLENCWDHQHWTPMDRRANVRTEAGRLLRTAHINELNELEQLGKTYDGLIIPGGRGVGWNL
uniref:DJ-1/PfpI domain-containing protein n=1 Tax=Trichogramma kaykai TaxID=54128 RepID=A0ABD2VUW2_9HYME